MGINYHSLCFFLVIKEVLVKTIITIFFNDMEAKNKILASKLCRYHRNYAMIIDEDRFSSTEERESHARLCPHYR